MRERICFIKIKHNIFLEIIDSSYKNKNQIIDFSIYLNFFVKKIMQVLSYLSLKIYYRLVFILELFSKMLYYTRYKVNKTLLVISQEGVKDTDKQM